MRGFPQSFWLRVRRASRETKSENRARGGSWEGKTFPEIRAPSLFSSPVLQYIQCTRLLSIPPQLKLKKTQGNSAEERVFRLSFANLRPGRFHMTCLGRAIVVT